MVPPKSFKPEDAVEAAGGVVALARRMGVSRQSVYRLIHPEQYGWCEWVFDLRSTLPADLAAIAGRRESAVRQWYLDRWNASLNHAPNGE